ncbi:hypothetical protein ABW20_dc0100330 [Dactylellina cionopaga]|nr:hypothetical protein ABW20_dc0100330 [Dactylellina cionopaga]
MAATSFQHPQKPRIGKLSLGLYPPAKINSKGANVQHLEELDVNSLKGYTAFERRKALTDLFSSGASPVYGIKKKKDVARYIEVEREAGVNDVGAIQQYLQRLLLHGREDADNFMRYIDEQETLRVQLQKEKSYYDREQESSTKNSTTRSKKSKRWNPFSTTPGWSPVKVGWKSHDEKLICVKEGTIPKFRYCKERNEDERKRAQPTPQIIWSGIQSYDDEHINHDIACKMLGLDESWKETPTGMFADNWSSDEDDSFLGEQDIDWSSKLLNNRLMLTCNSVHGSNVDLTFDPEELDVPTLDFERKFAKMECTLDHQYPNYVQPVRMFNQLGEMVIIPPPQRKEKVPRKTCLKNGQQWRYTRKRRADKKKNKKNVRFNLTHEEEQLSEKSHPRPNWWCRQKNKEIRVEAQCEFGWFEMLPSVRGKLTRVKGFEECYPPFLQPPTDSCLTETASHPTAYFLNHIARFKMPTLLPGKGKMGKSIRKALREVLQRRGNGEDSDDRFEYKLFTCATSGKKRFGPIELDREAEEGDSREAREEDERHGYFVYARREYMESSIGDESDSCDDDAQSAVSE